MMSRPHALLLALVWLCCCGTEGSLGLALGFASPAADQIVSEELYATLGEATEFPDGVAFFVDDQPVDLDALPPFECWIDTTKFSDGPVHLAAYPAGKAHASPIDEVLVVVDNHGPTITFESPLPGDCVPASGELTVRAHIEDHVGVRAVEVRIDERPVATLEGAPYEVEVLTGTGAEEHRLTIAAENARGRITNATRVVPKCPPPL